MTRPKADQKAASSFRDPSGFLFCRDGVLYRQVNNCYRREYDLLMNSGCYHSLVDAGLLVAHSEESIELAIGEEGFRIIKPDLIGFVSYPYEWSFSQLKDAALTTIRIQKKALEFGMSLKDCSAYNVQFSKGKPVFIDTLSFEKYARGKPWVAYRQFCQHFLAPLALMSYTDVRLSQLLRIYMDGIALDLASSLLPIRARLKFSLLTHIFVHARSQRHFEDRKVSSGRYKLSELSFRGLIDSLESAITRLKWRPKGTEWGEYYDDTNYSSCANEHKRRLVEQFCDRVNPKNVWDLGSNTGTFGRITASKGIQTVCFDIDPAAVEKNYLSCIEEGQTNVLPLLVDLRNPSGGIGWDNRERASLLERGPADMAFALALIHHLAISNNTPFGMIAEFFAKLCKWLVIEFVPKNDSQVQRLLQNREDVFTEYHQQGFEEQFREHFRIVDSASIQDSARTLYLMTVL